MLKIKNEYHIDINKIYENIIINKTIYINLYNFHQNIINNKYKFNFQGLLFKKNNLLFLEAEITGKVNLLCQYTLDKFEFDINNKIKFILVKNDIKFDHNDNDYEEYIYNNNTLNFMQIIEEEILLSIPLIPKKEKNCKKIKKDSYYNKNNSYYPFKVLKNMIIKDNIDGSTKK